MAEAKVSEVATTNKSSPKKAVLVEAATRLFARHGFHATGIDVILAVSGVAKRTLYNHFPSKEDLILEVLNEHSELFHKSLISQTQAMGHDPITRLLAIYKVAGNWFAQRDFYGCLFVKAAGEYTQQDSAIYSVCQGYKEGILEYFKSLCQEAGIENVDQLAQQLMLLLEGAIAYAHVSDNPEAAASAQAAAATLIEHAPKSA